MTTSCQDSVFKGPYTKFQSKLKYENFDSLLKYAAKTEKQRLAKFKIESNLALDYFLTLIIICFLK